MEKLKSEIKAFFVEKRYPHRQHFRNNCMKIYIRHTFRRREEGRFDYGICIANIEVYERYRGKQIGRNMIQFIHQEHPGTFTLVESVGNPWLRDWLIKNGWNMESVYNYILWKPAQHK
jgi:GNAT superfamily N-acetyltransferase